MTKQNSDHLEVCENISTQPQVKKKTAWRRLLSRLISWKTFVLFLILISLAYTAIGFWLVPSILQQRVLPELNASIRGSLSVERIRFNPYSFNLLLSNIQVKDEKGEPILTADRLIGDVDMASLWFGQGIGIQQIWLEGPNAKLILSPEGDLNLAKVFEATHPAPSTPEETPFEMPHLTISDCRLTNGVIKVIDKRLSPPFEQTCHDFHLSTRDFSTAYGVYNPIELRITTELEETLAIKTQVKLKPLAIQGQLKIGQLKLAHYYPHLRYAMSDQLKMDLPEGTLDLEIDWDLDPMSEEPKLMFGMSRMSLSDLKLQNEADADQTRNDLVNIPSLEIKDLAIDLAKRSFAIGEIGLEDGHAAVALLKDGTLDVQGVFESPVPKASKKTEDQFAKHQDNVLENIVSATLAADKDAKEKKQIQSPISGPIPGLIPSSTFSDLLASLKHAKLQTESPLAHQCIELATKALSHPWEFELNEIAIRDQSLTFTDHMPDKPLIMSLQELDLALIPEITENAFKFGVNMTGKINRSPISISGDVDLMAQRTEIKLNLKDLELEPFNHYLKPLANINIRKGAFAFEGRLIGGFKTLDAVPNLDFEGKAALRELEVLQNIDGKGDATNKANLPILKSDLISVKIGAVYRDDLQLMLEEILLDKPYLRLLREKDGQLAIMTLAKVSGPVNKPTSPAIEGAKTDRPANKKTPDVVIDLKKLEIKNGYVLFQDDTLSPVAISQLNELNAEFGPISYRLNQPLKSQKELVLPISIDTQLNHAPFSTHGEFDLGKQSISLNLMTDDVSIMPYLAYASTHFHSTQTGGRLTARGNFQMDFNLPETGGFKYSYKGDAALADIRWLEYPKRSTSQAGSLWRVGALAFKNAKFESSDLLLHADEMAIKAPWMKTEILPSSSDRQEIKVESHSGDPSSTQSAENIDQHSSDQLLPPIRLPIDLMIKKVTVTEGAYYFNHTAQEPPLSFHISKLAATISPLAGNPETRSSFKVTGLIAEKGKLDLDGQGALLDILRDTNAIFTVDQMPLMPFDSFSRQFAGYELDRGELTKLDSNIKIQKGILDVDNHITLGSLYLGDRINNRSVLNAQTKLGLALLRDRQDQIKVNLPIRGDLNNPRFNVYKVAQSLLSEQLKQVVTMPFDTLARGTDVIGKVSGIGVDIGGKVNEIGEQIKDHEIVNDIGTFRNLKKIGRIAHLQKIPGVGNLVKRRQEDLSYLVFEKGVATFDRRQKNKLDRILKAMKERPGIRLAYTYHPFRKQKDSAQTQDAMQKQRTNTLLQILKKAQLANRFRESRAISPAKDVSQAHFAFEFE